MPRVGLGHMLGRAVRFAATVMVTSAVTATIVMVLQPQPAHTELPPATTQSQYPVVIGSAPAVQFDSQEEFLADYVRLRNELSELKQAIDYDASKGGQIGPSVHEWADDRPAGAFGGGRKP